MKSAHELRHSYSYSPRNAGGEAERTMRVIAIMVPATPLMNAASLATAAISIGAAFALTVRACFTFLQGA